MPAQTIYVAQAPKVAPGPDGLIHLGAGCGLPARAMTRGVAILLARSLLSGVAALEDREGTENVVAIKARRGG